MCTHRTELNCIQLEKEVLAYLDLVRKYPRPGSWVRGFPPPTFRHRLGLISHRIPVKNHKTAPQHVPGARCYRRTKRRRHVVNISNASHSILLTFDEVFHRFDVY